MSEKNCKDLAKQPDIDGFLVGGASLKPACESPRLDGHSEPLADNLDYSPRHYQCQGVDETLRERRKRLKSHVFDGPKEESIVIPKCPSRDRIVCLPISRQVHSCAVNSNLQHMGFCRLSQFNVVE